MHPTAVKIQTKEPVMWPHCPRGSVLSQHTLRANLQVSLVQDTLSSFLRLPGWLPPVKISTEPREASFRGTFSCTFPHYRYTFPHSHMLHSMAMSPATTLPEFLSGRTLQRIPAPTGTIQGKETRNTNEPRRTGPAVSWDSRPGAPPHSPVAAAPATPRRAQRRGPRPAPVSLCVLALRYCRSFLTARSRTPFSLEASRWANWSSVDCMAGAIAPASASPGRRACRSPPSGPDYACARAAARG